MKLETGDYVVAQLDCCELCEILSVQEGVLRLLVCKTELLENPEIHEAKPEAVLANLGPRPRAGRVYGCDVEVAISVEEAPQFTVVQYAEFADETVLAKKQAAMAASLGVVEKYGFYRDPVTLHLRSGGDNASQTKDKWDATTRVLTVMMSPLALDHAMEVQRYLHSLLLPLWDILPGDTREVWLAQFAESANIRSFTTAEVRATLEWRRRYPTTKLWVKDGAGDDEDAQAIYGLWLAYVKKFYRLDSKEAEAMLRRETWETYLPQLSISSADFIEQITALGQKNAGRFFCETLSFYVLGSRLDAALAALCKATCSLNFNAVEQNYKLAMEEKAARRFVQDGQDTEALIRNMTQR